MQVSEATRLRAPRGPRLALAAVLACWTAGAFAFAVSPAGSDARLLVTVTVSWSAAAFAGFALARAIRRAGGAERVFWALLGAGFAFRFLGDLAWTLPRLFGAGAQASGLAPQDVAYAISYALLFGAMLRLVSLTTRGITLVSGMDAASIMLSVGTLAWYFVLGPGASELGGLRDAVVALSQPVSDSALLFLGLVAFSAPRKPRFIEPLISAFLAFLIADTVYLGLRTEGPYEIGNWPDLFWALGSAFLGVAALASTVAPTAPRPPERIEPWRILAFWIGPLSPPVHFGFLLLWGALHPPLPPYVLVGAAALLAYLAVRVGMVSFVSRRLSSEREEAARQLEQSRVLRDLHGTVKQSVHGISLTLSSALEAERRGERDAAREMFGRALNISRETEFQVSSPYEELRLRESPPSPGDFLRHRLAKFEEYFGIKGHEDLQAPLDVLGPGEIAAVNRVFVESLWNSAKHSGARNVYLESRRVGSLLMIRIRDDGLGFDPANPPPGMGLRYIRRRAKEVGAELDVISTPGRGTTIQMRFDRA